MHCETGLFCVRGAPAQRREISGKARIHGAHYLNRLMQHRGLLAAPAAPAKALRPCRPRSLARAPAHPGARALRVWAALEAAPSAKGRAASADGFVIPLNYAQVGAGGRLPGRSAGVIGC